MIRKHLKVYEELGIVFVRDGGDTLGVSERARRLAPEYGIDYRTPVFANPLLLFITTIQQVLFRKVLLRRN